ncbi:hypothetical protein [Pseudomonas knackmussii]|uniref:hypothetical protein n=1 Tax=Pseudomonas knackmussii TaxID=65741 RepID=UPI0013623B0D|nr:hypothetical protein [Pseudomonas knackmussii]
MAARNSKQQLCVVTVGYREYLLPQADALKLIDIMSRAATVESDYSGGEYKYVVGEAPRAELVVVRLGQLVMPQAEAAPTAPRSRRKSPALVEHDPTRLLGEF